MDVVMKSSPFSMTDGRGKESLTLTLVIFSWLTITLMFVWKGSAADITSYAAGCLAILTPWLGREWIEKANSKSIDNEQP